MSVPIPLDVFGEPILEKHKNCNSCKELLPLRSFGNDSGGNKLRSWCKKCDSINAKAARSIRKQTPTPDKNHKCEICNCSAEDLNQTVQHITKIVSPWVCDHDHKKLKFRGWLCRKCNLGLGNFNDDTDRLKNAIDYLNKHIL
jgi:hypothetical protein